MRRGGEERNWLKLLAVRVVCSPRRRIYRSGYGEKAGARLTFVGSEEDLPYRPCGMTRPAIMNTLSDLVDYGCLISPAASEQPR